MIKKIARAVTKRWGTPAAKQRAWDAEYKTGKWSYERKGPNNEDREPIYRFLEAYGKDGSILDLGCGSGMTALEMKNNFAEYVGVDISEVAVEKARVVLSQETGKANKVRFFASDISTFEPAGLFSVILFRESIYYVPQHRISAMLERYRSHLLPDGVLLVRLCDRLRYNEIINILEVEFGAMQVYRAEDSPMSIFISSPDGRARLQ